MTNAHCENPFQVGSALLSTRTKDVAEKTVDITWVISASLSMDVLWNTIILQIDKIADLFKNAMSMTNCDQLRTLRLSIIAYRDFYMDTDALKCSEFYDMSTQSGNLVEFVRSIRSLGGGIARKSGMEALFCAMHGKWLRDERDNEHIICVITDAEAYYPEDPQRRAGQYYEETLKRFTSDICEVMPDDMDGMRRLWRDGAGTLDNWHSSLVLLTPPCEPWLEVARWPRVFHYNYDAEGIRHLGLKTIVEKSCRPLRNAQTH